ncbi:MAG: DUF6122 family protein [Pseudomonadales bacterium]
MTFHLALHFLVPALIAALFFRANWRAAYFVMMATMLVDVDHLLANPIYDPGRCSIGFHPLHQLWFIFFYVALCFIPKTRWLGFGLSVHMALDAIDCQVTNGVWITPAI